MKKLYDKYEIYIINFFKYLTKDEVKPYEDKIINYFKNITEKSAKKNFSKKETNTGLKIFIAFASFLIALISFPLIFIFGPFWVAIYLSLSTSIMYAFFSKDLEDWWVLFFYSLSELLFSESSNNFSALKFQYSNSYNLQLIKVS